MKTCQYKVTDGASITQLTYFQTAIFCSQRHLFSYNFLQSILPPGVHCVQVEEELSLVGLQLGADEVCGQLRLELEEELQSCLLIQIHEGGDLPADVSEQSVLPDQAEHVLVAQLKVHRHGLVVLPLVGVEGGQCPEQGRVVGLTNEKRVLSVLTNQRPALPG